MWVDQNGDVYDGEFLNSKRHGMGRLKTENSDFSLEYIGEFLQGHFHGKGQLTQKYFSKTELNFQYNGEFIKGKKEG